MKVSEKMHKYLDLVWEHRIIEHMGNSDTNSSRSTWNVLQNV